MNQPTRAMSRFHRNFSVASLALVLVVALLPWWRNRGYVRDFFDYGVVIGGVGRIEQGQKPYVDFITPIQTGWYAFNWLAEKIAGGTFQAMTWSGAVSILVSVLVLGAMLARRWPWWAAAILAGAIAWASVSHHTILWYNPWGVVLLTVTAWAAAVAPVLRRETAGWHLLAAAALFLGGINKINIQALALALAFGWAARAGLLGREKWGRVALTWLFYGVCGVMLPVLAEMAWTGATFARWWHNVIAQMAGDRTGMLLAALKWETYVKPCHDYYDPLRLPQIGLAGVILTIVTVAAILFHGGGKRPVVDKILGCVCGVIAVAAGMLLLTTNMDIAYIAMAGWLGLLAALWLGFELPARGPWFVAGLVLPALVIGALAWESAWRGQRSQFGYSRAPREKYLLADKAGPAFSYFRGTHVTPEMFMAFESVGRWRASLSPERQKAVLYGPGTELFAHLWPALHTPDLPLYVLGGWQFGPKEYAATYAAVNGNTYKEITVSQVLDHWKPELARILRVKYVRHSLGEVFHRYSRADEGYLSDAPLSFMQMFGGSTDSRSLMADGHFFESRGGGERMFVGASSGKATMQLTQGTNRLNGEVIVSRPDPASQETLAAIFSIFAVGKQEQLYPRWEQRVELPAGQTEIAVEYSVDSSGLPARFTVEVPAESAGKVAAGWRAPTIFHSNTEGPSGPQWLHQANLPITILDAEQVDKLLPADRSWTPAQVVVRGGRFTERGLELSTGGELWVQVTGTVTDFAGSATLTGELPADQSPAVRGMWMKGARLEMFTRLQLSASVRTAEFQTWSAEPGGWLIVALDPAHGVGPVILKIDRFTHRN